jgi:hypothetical protein
MSQLTDHAKTQRTLLIKQFANVVIHQVDYLDAAMHGPLPKRAYRVISLGIDGYPYDQVVDAPNALAAAIWVALARKEVVSVTLNDK